jgi:AcrR family transcriptional regulator
VAADGKERILRAAEDLLIEVGISGLTVRAVAQAANVRPGLIHYHFESVEDLKYQVLERAARNWRLHTDETLVAAKSLSDLWKRWRRSMLETDEHRAFKLYVEMSAFAATDEPFRRATIAPTFEHLHKMLNVLASDVADPLAEAGPTLDRDAINALLIALATGLRFQRLFGVEAGHERLSNAITDWLERLEQAAKTETDALAKPDVRAPRSQARKSSTRAERRAPAKRTPQRPV